MDDSGKAMKQKEAKPLKIKTIPVAELVSNERLDASQILREGLREIPDGELAYDEQLRRDLGISCDRWREVKVLDEFKPYRATLPNRRMVWGQPGTITELRRHDGVQ